MIDLVDEQALNLEKATTKKQIVDKYVPAHVGILLTKLKQTETYILGRLSRMIVMKSVIFSVMLMV